MALPTTLNAALPQGSDSPRGGDDEIRALKVFIEDMFGIADSTVYTAGAFHITPSGAVSIAQPALTMNQLVLAQSTVASPTPLIEATTTWNESTTAMIGWRLNATDSASASTSLLVDLQVNSISKFAINKAGAVATQFSTVLAGPHAFGTTPDSTIQTLFGGVLNPSNGIVKIAATAFPAANADGFGLWVAPLLTVNASGSHNDFTGLLLSPPLIGTGSASLLRASTLKITGEPTEAIDNFALWVDNGKTRLDGAVGVGGTPLSSTYKIDLGAGAENFTATSVTAGYCVVRPVSIANTGTTPSSLFAFGIASAQLRPAGTDQVGMSMFIDAPTKGGVGTFDHMASLYIAAAPTGGTHNYALYINSGRLRLDTAGPHAIGGQESAANALYLTGIFGNKSGLVNEYRVQPTPNTEGALYLGSSAGTIDKAGSGTHALFAAMYLQPHTVTAGAAALTNNATLYISGQPTGGTNNYSLLTAAGTVKFVQDVNTVANLILDSTHTRGAMMQFIQNGTGVGYVGVDGWWKANTSTDMAIVQSGGAGIKFYTNGSGTPQAIMASGGGLQVGAPTGGDKGVGTINVSSGYYVNGALATPSFTNEFVSSDQTVSTATTLNVAHGLGAKPKMVQVTLKNTTAELGYSIGDEIPMHGTLSEQNAGNTGMNVVFDATNVTIVQPAVQFNIYRRDTQAAATITAASWRWVVRAWR